MVASQRPEGLITVLAQLGCVGVVWEAKFN